MDVYYVVKKLLKERRKLVSGLARELGVSIQSLNRSLHHGISLEKFNRIIESLGYVLMIGKVEDGRAVQIRTLSQIEREWKK